MRPILLRARSCCVCVTRPDFGTLRPSEEIAQSAIVICINGDSGTRAELRLSTSFRLQLIMYNVSLLTLYICATTHFIG